MVKQEYRGQNMYAIVKTHGILVVQRNIRGFGDPIEFEDRGASGLRKSDYRILAVFNGVSDNCYGKIYRAVTSMNRGKKIPKSRLKRILD